MSFRRLNSPGALLGLATLFLSSTFTFAATPLLSKHVPDIVTNGQAPLIGLVQSNQHLKLALSLPLRNEAALDAVLADIYNPQSPNFQHYLSVAEFTAQFGPTQADYDTLVSWAQAKGLTVIRIAANRQIVDVDGSVGAINKAFNISLNNYQDTVAGRTFHAPDREPTVDLPIALLAVSGLDNATPKQSHYKKGPAITANAGISTGGSLETNPVAHITGSGPGNTYLPSDMRAAYYGSGSLTGTGQTVGIFSYDGYLTNDITVYDSNTGMSSSVPVKNVLVNGYNGACFGFTAQGQEDPNTCDDGEQILDIVQVQGMAPGLTQILFYEGDSSTDVLNQMVTDNTAKVITSSWGGGDFGTASDAPFKEMAAQGQTYLNATGDSGAFNADTYDPPSVDPNIVQVGGTDLTTVSAGGAWKSETGWADSGGGYYTGTAIPTWQQTSGVITSTNKGSTTLRNSPDVAAEANFDNTTVIDGTFETGYGGTSYATPRYAGYIALANQQAVANGKSTLGFINPSLYTFGLSSSASTIYHDITSGSNPASEGSGSFTAVAGYDLVTGWGSPNGAGLINALAPAGTGTASYTLSASPSSLSVATGAKGTSTITITPSNGFTGTVALTASGLPTGVTAAFSPASATTTSTLTLTVASTATAGTSTITVTGTSGTLSKTTTVSLTVTKTATADYSLSASPSTLSVAVGAKGTSTITVTPINSFTGTVALTASGLPTGVTAAFSPTSTTTTSTLTLTVGSTAVAGTSTITITGTSGSLSHTTTVALTVTAGSSPTQLLGNTGFENGTTTTPWVLSSGVICSNSTCSGETSHAGSWFAWLDGYGQTHTDTASQSVAIPSGKTTATLSFYLHIDTAETTKSTAYDKLTVQVLNSSGTVLTTLATFSNLNAASGYVVHTYSLASYIGQTVTLKFTGTEDSSLQTSFVLDDVTLTVQ